MHHDKNDDSTWTLNLSHDCHESLIPQEVLALFEHILVKLIQKELKRILQGETGPSETKNLIFLWLW